MVELGSLSSGDLQGGCDVPAARKKERSPLSDDELLAVITRDLKAIYSDIIRQPLPKELAAALQRLETRSLASAPERTDASVPRPSRGGLLSLVDR